jgi:stearoyl-CoA desaturase (delta-9 desaturase)
MTRAERNANITAVAIPLLATMRRINCLFAAIVLGGLAVPLSAAMIWSGTLAGALEAFVWAGLVQVLLVHHRTWSVNSICHFFGSRRFETRDKSTNVFWLALATLGESWHRNHRAFPGSAFHRLRWHELDPSGLLIRALGKLRLAWDIVRVEPVQQRGTLAAPARERIAQGA